MYSEKVILDQRNVLTGELYGNIFQLSKSSDQPTLDKVQGAGVRKYKTVDALQPK
ncbi:hypothetical protein STEG23_034749, partial [Scotinomys teguina]